MARGGVRHCHAVCADSERSSTPVMRVDAGRASYARGHRCDSIQAPATQLAATETNPTMAAMIVSVCELILVPSLDYAPCPRGRILSNIVALKGPRRRGERRIGEC